MCPQLCYVTAAVGLTLTISYLMCLKVLNKSTPYLLGRQAVQRSAASSSYGRYWLRRTARTAEGGG